VPAIYKWGKRRAIRSSEWTKKTIDFSTLPFLDTWFPIRFFPVLRNDSRWILSDADPQTICPDAVFLMRVFVNEKDRKVRGMIFAALSQ
jgi:hypothetical protein